MRTRRKMRDQQRDPKRRVVARGPVSSHPEIEEEIERFGCALDESRLKVDGRRPTRKPIVSVDGCDVKDKPIRKDRAA
jgi:hypothetical protein